MKKSLTLLLLLTTALISRGQNKYPVVKSNLCSACVLWINPYYTSIADTQKKIPVVVYHNITKAHLMASDALKSNSATKIQRNKYPFHTLPGFKDEKGVFKDMNDSIKDIKRNPNYKKGDEVAEGHVASADDYSWSVGGMDTSMVHPFNLAIEWQAQNIGSELSSENMCRDTARKYGKVENWGGTYGLQGVHKFKGTSIVYPKYYWKICKWTDSNNKVVIHCLWMSNNTLGAGQQDLFKRFEIPLDVLVKNLGFNPMDVIKEY